MRQSSVAEVTFAYPFSARMWEDGDVIFYKDTGSENHGIMYLPSKDAQALYNFLKLHFADK